MMIRRVVFFVLILYFKALCGFVTAQVYHENISESENIQLNYSAYLLVNPPVIKAPVLKKPILVAVVDDAFRLSHKDLRGFMYSNPSDNNANLIDDDGNGKIDDKLGWDIADNDNSVLPQQGLESSFYHGTFVSSSIISLLKMCFGDEAEEVVKILPVKVLSDYSTLPDYSLGYKGIEYAIEQKADIICCAWSGGEPSEDQRNIIQKALDMGIIVIASSGNSYAAGANPPGSLPGVLTVGGIDSIFQKIPSSNYGKELDLVAPAQNVKAAYPLADNSYFYGEGTSGAAGIVTGCAAVLKVLYSDLKSGEIIDALINTARPVDKYNLSFGGKLGAGIPNLSDAAAFLNDNGNQYAYFLPTRPKGKIYANNKIRQSSWDLHADGAYNGYSFSMENRNKKPGRNRIYFYTSDSLWFSTELKNFPGRIFIPGSNLRVEFDKSKILSNTAFEINYEALPIDSATLYCQGIKYYQIPEATISDGSGMDNYAGNCDCKWQITAPEGKRISIEFEEFSTQARVDFVYLFDGESAIPGNMIAKFSGSELPISITSRTNKVLVWFVSDAIKNESGWTLNYRFVDD